MNLTLRLLFNSTITICQLKFVLKIVCTYHFLKKKKKIVAIVAMPLPKMGGKKNSGCQNHMWGIKKKSATSTIFLQH